jgi:hypothetical protein
MALGDKFTVDIEVSQNGKRRPEINLVSDLGGEATLGDLLEFTKQSLILVSDEILREEQANGFDSKPVVVVDGRFNKPPSAVNPLGSIEFVSRVDIDQVIIDAYRAVLNRSPILTGRYIFSNVVVYNGRQVASDLGQLEAWLKSGVVIKDRDIIRIVNTQPYARKLERRGVTGQRTLSRTVKSRDKEKAKGGLRVSAPNGAYYLASRTIKAKYKRNSVIRFSFLPGNLLGLSGSFKTGKKGSVGRSYLYPALTISVDGKGVL